MHCAWTRHRDVVTHDRTVRRAQSHAALSGPVVSYSPVWRVRRTVDFAKSDIFVRDAFPVSDARIPDGPSSREGPSWEELLLERLTYTVVEVAELLGISRTSAYECVRRGEIPAVMLGHRLVISRGAIERVLATPTNTPIPSERVA